MANKTYEDINEWLRQLKSDLSDEEYIRLNYKVIIDSIVSTLMATDVEERHELFNELLEALLKTLDYNRRHPSPQRSLCFVETVEQLLTKVRISGEQMTTNGLNTENFLIKIIKLMIKDSNCSPIDCNNESIIRTTDKLFKILEALRVWPKLSPNSQSVIVLNNLILNTIRCIYILINNFKYNIISRDLNQFCGQLLGLMKSFAFYGIPGFDVSKIRSSALFPSPFTQYNELTESGSNERKGSVNKKNRHKKTKSKTGINNEDLDDDNDCLAVRNDTSNVKLMTSDSEFSSSDYESVQTFDGLRIERSIANKIRIISYESLSSALNLFDKRVVFGFWSSFIQSPTPGSLLWAIPREPSARVRSSALNFLHKLLLTGDPYVMTLANDSTTKSGKALSFTSLSQSLAQMVAEIHNGMQSILLGEQNNSVLIQTFKCLSLLVTITPYKKLKNGLLVELFDRSLTLLSHKDIQIQNSCLALAVKIFELEPFPEQLKSWVETSSGVQVMNRLLDYTYDAILTAQSILLCGESLKLLTTVLKQKLFFESLLKSKEIHLSLDLLMTVSTKCLENDIFITNLVVQSLVSKYLFALGTNLKTVSDKQVIASHKNWWLSVLKSKLIVLGLNATDASIPQSTQCVIIDFISTISPEVFESFEPKLRFHLISVLISIVKNSETTGEDLNCQSAAIRCLGVYQSFQSMIEDLNYLFDVSMLAIEILDTFADNYYTKKSSHLLLYQSSWTLANFCDILKKFYANNCNEISIEFLFRLIESNLNCYDLQFSNAMQSENIKTNLVRCAGSALYLILIREQNESTLDLQTDSDNKYSKLALDLIQKLIQTLITSKNFKLQWNICIVFSYLLEIDLFLQLCKSNTSLAKVPNNLRVDSDANTSYQLIDCIFDTLFNLMQSRNHKVQCYAVFSICSANNSYLSGQYLKDIWIFITTFMIKNYSLVPINIRNNWFSKFCVSINKLINNYFNTEIRNDPKIKETINCLKDFLTNDTFVINSDQQNSEFVKSLIQSLN